MYDKDYKDRDKKKGERMYLNFYISENKDGDKGDKSWADKKEEADKTAAAIKKDQEVWTEAQEK